MPLSKLGLVDWLEESCSKGEILAVLRNLCEQGYEWLELTGSKSDLVEQLDEDGPQKRFIVAAIEAELGFSEDDIEEDLSDDDYDDDGDADDDVEGEGVVDASHGRRVSRAGPSRPVRGARVVLSWRKTVVDDIAYQDDAYVYALVRNGRLLYIGKSYKTKVSNEVRANMASFRISKRNLVVYLGDFQTDDFRGRMDRLVHHVEALLIYDNQPEYNDHHKNRPPRTTGLEVSNRNCGYLSRTSEC